MCADLSKHIKLCNTGVLFGYDDRHGSCPRKQCLHWCLPLCRLLMKSQCYADYELPSYKITDLLVLCFFFPLWREQRFLNSALGQLSTVATSKGWIHCSRYRVLELLIWGERLGYLDLLRKAVYKGGLERAYTCVHTQWDMKRNEKK